MPALMYHPLIPVKIIPRMKLNFLRHYQGQITKTAANITDPPFYIVEPDCPISMAGCIIVD